MPSNKGTGKLLVITGAIIFVIAIVLIIFFWMRRNSCPAEVNFEISPGVEVMAGDMVTLTDKTVKAKGWEWDFGDNSAKEVYRTNRLVHHKYQKDGSYIITLKVNGGCKSVSKTILVKSQEVIVPPTPDLVPVIQCDVTTAYVGQKVKFIDGTQGSVSWEWFFENGRDIFTEKEVTYQFVTPGEKTIQLMVNGGKSQTASFKLKVLPPKLPRPAPEPGPVVEKKEKEPKPAPHLKPLVKTPTEAEFKVMLLDFVKGKVQMKDFMPFMNSNITMKIKVNEDQMQFDSFLKELILENNPRVDKVIIDDDPTTGYIIGLTIKKN